MLRSELIKQVISQFPNLPEAKIAAAVNYIIDMMANSLQQGQRIEIRGFGSFEVHHRAPRRARNPKTGQTFVTEAKGVVRFKPAKALRSRVNKRL